MKKLKPVLLLVPILLLTISVFAALKSSKKNSPIVVDRCTIVGRTNAIIHVWEEKADNTKGAELLPARNINTDERISISSARGRIIYDYKYRSQDNWTTDVHAWCHNGEDRKIP